jgi:hypothetical protein
VNKIGDLKNEKDHAIRIDTWMFLCDNFNLIDCFYGLDYEKKGTTVDPAFFRFESCLCKCYTLMNFIHKQNL